MKNIKLLIGFTSGVILMLLIFLAYKSLETKEPRIQNDFYIITNQIKKMNKMVVMEQNFSSMQKTKISTQFLGGLLPDSNKEIITFTKTNAQVSYDLNQMKIEVDSINKEVIIKELPNAEIKIIPSVEIQSMDDSFFNRINENDLKKIQDNAKANAVKTVNQNHLRTEGRKQLSENLNQIFVLAKTLNYKVTDKTGKIDTTKL